MRYFRRSYYSFVKYVDLPSLNWVLITLTFSRSISLQDVYANLGSWVSAFLKRFREYLRKKGFRNFIYLWVVEIHDDGYPHVHILSTFPFVDINRIYSWWRDSCGNSLSAFQGIDVKFIGRNVQKVKNYVLKYMVKSHGKYWAFSLRGDRVTVRLSTLLLWYFRVRIFSSSRHLFIRRCQYDNSSFSFTGYVSVVLVYQRYYEPYGITFKQFLLGLYYSETLEKEA
ncbi:hypothetical protein [Hydrogenobacter thermophilus]|uniref:rolling circle replication-associated protein n=1 Tax=Hydrogenobacter thermophilus TaxID=940 RepID=UPI0030FB3DC7